MRSHSPEKLLTINACWERGGIFFTCAVPDKLLTPVNDPSPILMPTTPTKLSGSPKNKTKPKDVKIGEGLVGKKELRVEVEMKMNKICHTHESYYQRKKKKEWHQDPSVIFCVWSGC